MEEMQNRGKATTYKRHKDKLLKMVLARNSLDFISSELKVSVTTACRFRKKLLKEMGTLSDKRIIEIRRNFVTTSIEEVEFSKKKIIQVINEGNNQQKTNAINCLSGLLRTQTELLSRFNVVSPQALNIKSQNKELSIEEEFKEFQKLNKKND